ncbi:MAG: radical SAM protein [Planctomycetes bacterium]|nr:radical SAM protein [Planctomycetota bacterium]
MNNLLYEDVLPRVQQPAQYTGGEWNAVVKDHGAVGLTFALAFPDTYPIAMSHLGIAILYDVLNREPDIAAERVFMPLPDMQAELRSHSLPLASLETHTPLTAFDAVGFSLQYELCYTNVLAMLDLAGIPLRSAERGDCCPIIVAGGPGAMAPEPLAPFIDLFAVGDGEEMVLTLARAIRSTRGLPRSERLRALANASPHFYVPSLYGGTGSLPMSPTGRRPVPPCRPGESGGGTGILPVSPTGQRPVPPPLPIRRAVVRDIERAAYPERPIVPFVETVHDRITLELMRGCTQGCRFCQAGMTRRPVRARSVERLLALARAAYAATGHNEVSLASLSSSDYPHLRELLRAMAAEFDPKAVNVALSSLRVGDQLSDIPALIRSVRKAGLTIAPEAAHDALRRRINKNITTEDLLRGARQAYEQGWRAVKLYFMIGLPGETEADVSGIVDLAREVSAQRGGRGGEVNVTVSSFVPKPHTPFQWEPMDAPDVLRAKQSLIRSAARGRRVKFKFHDVEASRLEAVLSRGDRRVAEAVERAWRLGAQLDAWDEHFRPDLWRQAFEQAGVRPEAYANRRWAEDEPLPWDHIHAGVTKDFLLAEKHKAERGEATPDCREGQCTRCGACLVGNHDA